MDFEIILEAFKVLIGITALSGLFYAYFKYESVQNIVKKTLPFLPHALAFFDSRAEDKQGIFDQHDFLILLGRVTERIKETINDPTNKEFEDVENEVFEIVSEELSRYRSAGVANVPNLDDPAVRTQVRLVFETIKATLGED